MHVRWFRCLGGIFGSCVRCSRSASRQLVRVSAFHGKWPIPNIWDIKWHEVTSSDMKYELVMEWDIKIHKVHVFWVGPVQTLASGSLAILWPCQVHVQKKVDKILRQDTGYIVNIIYIYIYVYICIYIWYVYYCILICFGHLTVSDVSGITINVAYHGGQLRGSTVSFWPRPLPHLVRLALSAAPAKYWWTAKTRSSW